MWLQHYYTIITTLLSLPTSTGDHGQEVKISKISKISRIIRECQVKKTDRKKKKDRYRIIHILTVCVCCTRPNLVIDLFLHDTLVASVHDAHGRTSSVIMVTPGLLLRSGTSATENV